jgi:hypothetical protein
MASIRFPKIGSIIKLSDGTYSIGGIPGIGGPFDTAAEFFRAWAKAKQGKFALKEDAIRERTPSYVVEEVIKSINDFPGRLMDFTLQHSFQNGPFPLFHPDLWISNILVDSKYRIQGVIDWEDSIVAPWEMVEFIKDLTIVPPVMDGPLYREKDSYQDKLAERARYVQIVERMENAQQLDNKLSKSLSDWNTQNLAQAIWLYNDGRIGFYTHVLDLFQYREGEC